MLVIWSVSTIVPFVNWGANNLLAFLKRLRAGQDASVEQIVAISVALHLPPLVSGDLLRMCGITLDFNNQKNTVYQMILTEYYKEGIEQVNVCLAACGCAPLKTAC